VLNLSWVKKSLKMIDYVFNVSTGIGDCLSCFNTKLPIWSPSPHYQVLRKYSSLNTLDNPLSNGLKTTTLHEVDYGSQHLFNRVRIATGLDPLDKPKAILDLVEYNPLKEYIAFSFDVGSNVQGQTFLHPRPRQLYPEHRRTIQEFISKNKDKYTFVEVGVNSFGFADTVNMTGIGLEKTIETLSVCNHYFGMHSGMMHLATAIGIECTIIINFPSMARMNSAPSTDLQDKMEWEKQWLYPQHNYLHEDELGSITIENLKTSVC
jgi:hypothetical protein